jgi:vacuolar-type H+-ATPase subunit H
MDRVLQAEKEAQDAVADAREQAREILREAREHVRQIEERARAWRGRVHRACEDRAQGHMDRMRHEAGLIAADIPTESEESELVSAACARLAARLTGRP